MLDPIRDRKPQIFRNIRANVVGIENHRLQKRREHSGQGGFPGSRQAHDQNFIVHGMSLDDERRIDQSLSAKEGALILLSNFVRSRCSTRRTRRRPIHHRAKRRIPYR
ncbi:hypothetical protein [Methylocapsa aurea]|uniref:hypothetical protein n=1 Tax=Methylocapsa aurea TaxID=663610 RepID=UPI003D18E37F